jgi:hypothetical protein
MVYSGFLDQNYLCLTTATIKYIFVVRHSKISVDNNPITYFNDARETK